MQAMAYSLDFTLSKLLPQCAFKQLQQIHDLIVTTPLNQNIQIFSKLLRRSTDFGSMEYTNLIFSQLGRQLSNDIVIQNAMIRDLITARKFFETMPCKNVVSWNNMISSYTQHGQYEKALDAFVQMQSEGVVPDGYIFVSVLSACSHSGALEFGKWTHRAFALFIKIGKRDVFCWNAMIRSVAIHGRAEDAVKLYSLMRKEGLKANDFTFTAALFACSHGGLVEEGERIFYAMEKEFGIVPKLEHFGCLIEFMSSCLTRMPRRANGQRLKVQEKKWKNRKFGRTQDVVMFMLLMEPWTPRTKTS